MWRLWTLAFVASIAVAVLFLPRWTLLVVAACWVGVGLWIGRSSSRAVAEGVARSRGFVLREATVWVEELEREPVSDGRVRLKVRLTITPRPGQAQSRPWQPRELRLLAADSGAALLIELIEIGTKRTWTPHEGATLTGKQQLRLTLPVPAASPRLILGYYLEELADVDLVPPERDLKTLSARGV